MLFGFDRGKNEKSLYTLCFQGCATGEPSNFCLPLWSWVDFPLWYNLEDAENKGDNERCLGPCWLGGRWGNG